MVTIGFRGEAPVSASDQGAYITDNLIRDRPKTHCHLQNVCKLPRIVRRRPFSAWLLGECTDTPRHHVVWRIWHTTVAVRSENSTQESVSPRIVRTLQIICTILISPLIICLEP